MSSVCICLLAGPTALLEVGGLRLLTDPTFDPPGEYPLPGGRVLVKTASDARATRPTPSRPGASFTAGRPERVTGR